MKGYRKMVRVDRKGNHVLNEGKPIIKLMSEDQIRNLSKVPHGFSGWAEYVEVIKPKPTREVPLRSAEENREEEWRSRRDKKKKESGSGSSGSDNQ